MDVHNIFKLLTEDDDTDLILDDEETMYAGRPTTLWS